MWSDPITTLGKRAGTYAAMPEGSLANWRIGAGSLTEAEIKRIYNDEKHLFTENSKCTLAGTSDSITALDSDSVTGELHAATSGGRSVFQGLRRVDEDTGTASQSLTSISAKDGLLMEGK